MDDKRTLKERKAKRSEECELPRCVFVRCDRKHRKKKKKKKGGSITHTVHL
jgi:hypothetical protein